MYRVGSLPFVRGIENMSFHDFVAVFGTVCGVGLPFECTCSTHCARECTVWHGSSLQVEGGGVSMGS